MANILISTHWVGGDVIPFIRLAEYLKEQGHSVRIFSHYGYQQWVEDAGVNFTPWENEDSYHQLQECLPDFLQPFSQPELFQHFRQKYLSPERRLKEFNILAQYANEPGTILIGRCRSSIAAMHLSEIHQLPFISVYLAPSNLSYMALINQAFKATLDKEVNDFRALLQLDGQTTWQDYQFSSVHNFGFWPNWFSNEAFDSKLDISHVGFPLTIEKSTNIEKPRGLLPEAVEHFFLTNPKPVLITGGTSQLVSKDLYRTAIDACAQANRPAIVVTEHDHMLPSELPKQCIRARKLPFEHVFSRCSLVIHHGGIGSSAQCVRAGVSQLVLAHMTDGPDNARKLEAQQVARFLPQAEWTTVHLLKAMEELGSKSVLEHCQSLAELTSQEQPFEAVHQRVQKLLESGGGYIPHPSSMVADTSDKPKTKSKTSINKKALLMRRLKKKSHE
ncbi:glycosyltransferase [Vibrio penaeicida]|uniref:glycosyltransferase n=1 Tax=Vibrio penaeicida TaxID=104609 RepID=UPI000CEA16E2|nr:nucleotide disphospho-sugar-binding domain-containing protein [Vibrio penaeicida]